MLQLYIGNKNYSSWSMRPWLLMKQAGIPFIEHTILLDQPDTAAQIRAVSPSGRVPALVDSGIVVHDSLAIAEYLNEKFPEKKLWPEDLALRAQARAWCAEIHSGLTALRAHCPMNVRKRVERTPLLSDEVGADIKRVCEIWETARSRRLEDGDFLLGRFSILDAYYWPVLSRFWTYQIRLAGAAAEYSWAMLQHQVIRDWHDMAAKEEATLPKYDAVGGL